MKNIITLTDKTINIQYNLGKDFINNELDCSTEKIYKGTIAPYWYPFASEAEYMKSMLKDYEPIKMTWPI